jgi:hypothetical protein
VPVIDVPEKAQLAAILKGAGFSWLRKNAVLNWGTASVVPQALQYWAGH